jgi:GPH family glycoside/pentoside/hexuronide:cation symporter
MSIVPAMSETFRNGPFLILVVFMLLLSIGGFGFVQFSYYVNIYYVFGGDADAASTIIAVGGFVIMATEMAALWAFTWLGTKIGKRNGLLVSLLFLGIGPLSSWFLYTPKHPWLQLAMAFIFNPGVPGVVMFPYSMLADVVDQDELKTGRRREGAFYALFGFVGKLAVALLAWGAGYCLKLIGFDETLVQQTPDVILRLRLLFALGLSVPAVLSIPLILLYPLNEKRVRETRAILEQRRQKSLAEDEA